MTQEQPNIRNDATPGADNIRSAYEPHHRVQIKCGGGSRTKQSFKAECDINNIMAKYQKTGSLAHAQQHQGEYGFASAVSFHEAMNIVTQAEQMFASLPSTLRNRFSNDPGAYLDFVQNPDNEDEMRELGLLVDREPSQAETIANAVREGLANATQQSDDPSGVQNDGGDT